MSDIGLFSFVSQFFHPIFVALLFYKLRLHLTTKYDAKTLTNRSVFFLQLCASSKKLCIRLRASQSCGADADCHTAVIVAAIHCIFSLKKIEKSKVLHAMVIIGCARAIIRVQKMNSVFSK